ncbi:MAG: NAD(P)/FAD-dependent oxidoreductase [Oscillospiraceae bacterium]|jgi:2,4-dienoyl-CoA reductase-like NADH-dependent reductase (Old Yellow Enzyme family)/thioredoxin reductase|nr:NAD(P)/FAD-dependent oxidoreductase [Oscillospiraceae bacterium]
MAEYRFPELFKPIRLGGTTFRNRIFSSPQDTYRLTGENFLNDDATAFYEVKALGGFASVCLGDFMVDSLAGHSHPFQLRGDDVKGRVSLTKTLNAITRHGAVSAVELNHAGGNGGVLYERNGRYTRDADGADGEGFIFGVSDGERGGVPVRAMDEAWIERLIGCYAEAAAFARKCGAGMITLHGGHGWLLAQFMSRAANHRKDGWGGTLKNRMRFPLAVVKAVRDAVGASVPIEMRISGAEHIPDGYGIEEGVRIAKALDGLVDLIHVSAGHHENDAASMITHPTMFLPDGVNVKYAAAVKKKVKTPVATVGALTEPAHMEEILRSGQADVVQLGRQTLADPDLPAKARCGREDEVNQCLRCLTCFSASTSSGIFYCAVNPVIGRERDALYAPPVRKRKKVLVAGGGVAGMQAALTAVRMGHEVILCEKGSALGGTLLCEAGVPFKKKLMKYLERQALLISRTPIRVQLGVTVTPKVAQGIAPDAIIAALGARPILPKLPGIGRAVMAEDVYTDLSKAGREVCIIGGGLVGLELGIYLAQHGRNVTVVEMAPTTLASGGELATSERISRPEALDADANIVHGIALAQEIKKLDNMRILTSTKALAVLQRSLRVEGPDGVCEIEAGSVVCAVGQSPLTDEAAALSRCAPEFYQVGDCLVPKNIQAATQAAYQAARDIGRF